MPIMDNDHAGNRCLYSRWRMTCYFVCNLRIPIFNSGLRDDTLGDKCLSRLLSIIVMLEIDVFILRAACHVISWCNLRIPICESGLLDETLGAQRHD